MPLPTPRTFPQASGGRALLPEPTKEQYGDHVPALSPPQVPSFRHHHEPQIPDFVEGEGVESFFVRFERIARTWGWQTNEWAVRVVTLLTGKALEAYAGMDELRSGSYDDIKAAVLSKYNVTEETYRLRCRSLMIPTGESLKETYNRIKGLNKRWMRPETKSKEQVGETIILEQYLRVLRPDVRVWVKENQPQTGEEAARLAEREVPQCSTGFSPFELLFGRQVRGPLDVLKEGWTAEEPAQCNIASYILQMRDKLENFRTPAKEYLSAAQQRQKVWYDTHARERDLEPGQKVLVLLPSGTSKLLAKWQGPYVVTRKLGPVTYEILCPERKQPKQVLHVNLLREFKERVSDLYGPTDVKEQAMMERPGRTEILTHNIILKDTTPVWQKPYRVPEKMVEQLKSEIEAMLEMGIIEPSNSGRF
ncbi:hypothetical protein PO909_025663 [Leuciscus waleckii]